MFHVKQGLQKYYSNIWKRDWNKGKFLNLIFEKVFNYWNFKLAIWHIWSYIKHWSIFVVNSLYYFFGYAGENLQVIDK